MDTQLGALYTEFDSKVWSLVLAAELSSLHVYVNNTVVNSRIIQRGNIITAVQWFLYLKN